MELQAIREKLRSLQTDHRGGEVLSPPWAPPRPKGDFINSSKSPQPARDRQLAAKTEATPPAAAITALQKRAVSQPYGSSHHVLDSSVPSSTPLTSTGAVSTVSNKASDKADELIAQELFQLEILASNINERSQQQAQELLHLKRSAQQAAFHLRHQGIHTHPQLNVINQFLEQSSTASLPNIERDTYGQFCLTHTAVNLNQAEAEASDNAELLRRQQSLTVPFSQPVTNGPDVREYLKQGQRHRTGVYQNESYQDEKRGSEKYRDKQSKGASPYKRTITRLKRYVRHRTRPRTESKAHLQEDQSIAGKSTAYTGDTPSKWLGRRADFPLVDFPLIDGTIWFVSAVIIRVLLNALVISHPFLQMPLLLVLVGAISYSIYRIVLSKSTDMSATYRIGSALLGLFVGSTL